MRNAGRVQRQVSAARQGRRGGGGVGAGGGVLGKTAPQFLAPHTGRSALKSANAEAAIEFNPAIRESRQQARGSTKRSHDISNWYSDLAKEYGQSQAAANTAFQTAQGATTQRLADAGARSAASLKDLSSKDASFAALVGGPTNAGGLSKMADASAAAQRSSAALTAPIASTQASYIASLGGRRIASRMKGIEAKKEESDRRTKILSNLAAARKEKGLAKVSNVEKIRQSDRGYSNELKDMRQKKREAAISAQQNAQQIAISQQSAATSARSAGISARQSQERIGIERRNAKTSARSQRATARHYKEGGAKGGLTASEARGIKEGHQNAAATSQSLFEAKKWPSWASLERAVSKESEVSPAEARAAVARLRQHVEGAASKKAAAQSAAGKARLGRSHR